MKKIAFLLSFVLCAAVILPFPAEAARKHNRPWLSKKERSAQVQKKSNSRQVAARKQEAPRLARSKPAKRAPGEKIAQQAKRYQGARYRFGGTSPAKGFDCSGLVARVWADLNLKKIPRASSALYRSGRPVHLAELMPGDLVFFKNTYKRGISHVGIYAGKNKFVHAPGERKRVSITKLSDPYYQLHYAGARRLY